MSMDIPRRSVLVNKLVTCITGTLILTESSIFVNDIISKLSYTEKINICVCIFVWSKPNYNKGKRIKNNLNLKSIPALRFSDRLAQFGWNKTFVYAIFANLLPALKFWLKFPICSKSECWQKARKNETNALLLSVLFSPLPPPPPALKVRLMNMSNPCKNPRLRISQSITEREDGKKTVADYIYIYIYIYIS